MRYRSLAGSSRVVSGASEKREREREGEGGRERGRERRRRRSRQLNCLSRDLETNSKIMSWG